MKNNSETSKSAADGPRYVERLVRHLVNGGRLKRWMRDGPNEAMDNFHELRLETGRFIVTGFGCQLLDGDICATEVLKNPQDWYIVPNAKKAK